PSRRRSGCSLRTSGARSRRPTARASTPFQHDDRRSRPRVPADAGHRRHGGLLPLAGLRRGRAWSRRLDVCGQPDDQLPPPRVVAAGRVQAGGSEGRRAGVAITDGVITEIGPDLSGERELDASGCAVTPGFIDIHTHYDAQVFWDPRLRPSSYHGVTTVVAGNCGFAIAPTREEHHEVIARTLENVEDMNVDTLAAGIAWDFTT